MRTYIGQKVTYVPEAGPAEHGIIKSTPEDDPEHVFVVYHCGGDWERYYNYIAARTRVSDLRDGWLWSVDAANRRRYG